MIGLEPCLFWRCEFFLNVRDRWCCGTYEFAGRRETRLRRPFLLIFCMPTAATYSTLFDSIIHPMDQGKSTFNYMSIGWLFRKIFRKKTGLMASWKPCI